jgi:hypothetical protein
MEERRVCSSPHFQTGLVFEIQSYPLRLQEAISSPCCPDGEVKAGLEEGGAC